MTFVSLALLFGVLSLGHARVTLTKRSTIYLPYVYDGNGVGTTALLEASAEQLTYDPGSKIAYVVGGSVMHAVDLSNPNKPTILAFLQYPNLDLTDVEFCGGFVFIPVDDQNDRTLGRVKVLSKYDPVTKSVTELYEVPVGAVPDMLQPTSDCSRVVVAVEGEAYEEGGQLIDPLGLVVIIRFPDGIMSGYNVVTLDFTAFDSQVDRLSKSGVRHVYQENNNPFSRDVEPEYVSINSDDTIAYVTLQENNAVATVDIRNGREEIISIKGLGFKDWSILAMDPSDKDGGAFLNSYTVLGMYQPDGTRYVRWKKKEFLIMANEGDAKDYSSWTEEVRGKDIDPSILPPGLNSTVLDQLSRDSLLGRLKFSTSKAGIDSSTGKLKALFAFGGRGFSLRRTDDLSLLYDSADDIGRITEYYKKDLFNSQIVDADNRPFEDFDDRSDDKGAETESVEFGKVRGRLLLFIGNERPGVIFVYSLEKGKSMTPVLQDVYDGIPDTRGRSWQELYDQRLLSEIDCEDMKFITKGKSPTRKHALLVTGAVTGTLSLLDVNISPGSLRKVQSCARWMPTSAW